MKFIWIILGLLLVDGGLARGASVAEFQLDEGGEKQRIVATLTPEKIRVDMPAAKFSIIYEEATEFFIGLEHRDAKYWMFSWPQVRESARQSRRAAAKFGSWLDDGATQAASGSSTPPPAIWRQEEQFRKILKRDCQLWKGDIMNQPAIEVWAMQKAWPELDGVLGRLRKINEPLALAAARPLFPTVIFAAADSLRKAEVTPLEFQWSSGENHFRIIAIGETRPDPSLFTVPQSYSRTSLTALEGIVDPK